jgi:hypothetical protein
MLTIGLSYLPNIMLRNILSVPSFFRAFIMKGCWILLKSFSASIQKIMWVLSLLMFICCITFIDLCMLNHPYILGMNLIWSWCMIFLMCCWILFVSILVRIFASIFIQDIGLKFSFFFFLQLYWFWNECNAGFMEWI